MSLPKAETVTWRLRRLDRELVKIGEEWSLSGTDAAEAGAWLRLPTRVGVGHGRPLHDKIGSGADPPEAPGGGRAELPRPCALLSLERSLRR